MKITDEIKAVVNKLYDAGFRGNSNSYKGMKVKDEEHLTSLLMKATPIPWFPSIHDLDKHDALYNMISRYIEKDAISSAVDIADHLKNLFIDYFQPTIQQLMDDAHLESKENQHDRKQLNDDINRDIHAHNRQKI